VWYRLDPHGRKKNKEQILQGKVHFVSF
jgi:hypothetical protein